jgi:GH24 family phage-related lysozyme (muramidase)
LKGKGMILDKFGMSDKGIEFLKTMEGNIDFQRRRGSYADGMFYIHNDGADYPTIGYGHKIKPGEDFSGGITEKEAERLLKEDIRIAEDDLRALVKDRNLSQNEIDSLVSFLYNAGNTRKVRDSNTILLINKGLDFNIVNGKTLEQEFKEFNTSRGNVVKALVDRRSREWDLFQNGVY